MIHFMNPSHHPLIESITQPFAENAEMKLSAAQILEETFDPYHSSVPHAIQRLERQDKKKFVGIRKSAIWLIAVVVLGFTIYSEAPLIRAVINFDDLLYSEQPEAPAFVSHLTEQEKLLLGNTFDDELTQKQRLFESDPNNPAYFSEYAEAYLSHHEKLPDDFLETASRIDPDNSFFLYWAAGQLSKSAVETNPKISSGGPAPAPRMVDGVRLRPLPTEVEHTILDQAAYEEALKLIERAGKLPKFNAYSIDMMKARVRLIPQPQTYIEYVAAVAYQFSAPSNGIFSFVNSSRLLNARAEELSKKGEKDAFLDLTNQRQAFLKAFGSSENHSLGEMLIYQVTASSTATNFHAAAKRLGLSELEETYRKQNEAFIAERDRRDLDQRKTTATGTLIEQKAGVLHCMSIPMVGAQVAIPPVLTDSDLKPMRMAEYELGGRLGVLSIGHSFLLCALFVFFFRFLASRAVRLTAKCITGLLNFSDWLWITSLGVVLPILAFLYISRISPFSGRDHGVSHFMFLFPSLHLTVLLLNLLFIPAVITRWRLKRRAAAFRFGSWMDWLSLPVIVVMLIYSIAAYPAVVKFPLNTPMQIALAAPLVGWLGFVFFHALRIFLGNARSRILQTTTAIAVLPAYAVAIIALCLLMPIYQAGEKHWIPQDKLILIDPDAPDLGAYEFKVAAQKRREINEILGF